MTTQQDSRSIVPPVDDTIIGERIHTLMWRSGRKQEDLAAALGLVQTAVSRKMRGQRKWGAVELAVAAQWLGVCPARASRRPAPQPR